VKHTLAFHRLLHYTVHYGWFRYSSCFQNRWADIDYVTELVTNSTLFLDALRPMDDHTVPSASPMRSDLLRPLVGCVHRPGPANRVMIIRIGRTELVKFGHQEFRSLNGC